MFTFSQERMMLAYIAPVAIAFIRDKSALQWIGGLCVVSYVLVAVQVPSSKSDDAWQLVIWAAAIIGGGYVFHRFREQRAESV